jgi:DNA-binding NarL/FixJ family response regulator
MVRILIDEPSPAVSRLLVHLVEWLGHEPLIAGAAWEDERPPDVALVEPGFDDDYARVRSVHERWPTLPVVALGVYPRSKDLVELGVSGFVPKPFAIDDLERAVAAALRSR